MGHTLREITDAIWATGPRAGDKEERQRIYDRARMLRDKKLLPSSEPRTQGKTMTFTDADTVAGIVAITASLNGQSWGGIQSLIEELHPVGNIQGKTSTFSSFLSEIKNGDPVIARLDIVTHPWPHTVPRIGRQNLSNFDKESGFPPVDGTTQIIIWPVTELAKPVLDLLNAKNEEDE